MRRVITVHCSALHSFWDKFAWFCFQLTNTKITFSLIISTILEQLFWLFDILSYGHMITKDLACILITLNQNYNQIHNTGGVLSSFGLSASSNGGPTVQSAVGTYCTGIPSQHSKSQLHDQCIQSM